MARLLRTKTLGTVIEGVTQATLDSAITGVTSSGTITSPTLNTGVSGSAVLDEDAMGSNSATKLATQQSIKAYSDLKIPLAGGTFTGAVTIPSAVLNTAVSGSAVLDEDNLASNSATKLATQQSIKAYVDSSPDAGLAENLKTLSGDLTIGSTKSTIVCGPVTIPNLTINGNLAVSTSLNVTTDLEIASAGSLNIIG
jgi:hypothetical protein